MNDRERRERDDRPRGDRRGGRPGRDRADGERRPRRDGEQRSEGRARRDGERRPPRDGERRFEKDRPRRDGERKFDGRPRRDGERRFEKDRPRRDGERKFEGRPRRDGDRRPARDGDRPSTGRGGTRGGGRSDRGGRERNFTEAERLQHELRPVRAEHADPDIPDDVTENDLNRGARNELKTLAPETQEWVARHLAMVAALIDDDPELAHQHAISASRRAGRIPVVRETLAATAYRVGDYALALRELRTHRRLSGSQGNIALMVEAERALGRPQKAIETGHEADLRRLETAQRVQLAIAMSGARLDLGQTLQARFELEIPELNPARAYSYSPELFAAYAAVLEDLGREADAKTWRARAEAAERALNARLAESDELEVFEVYEFAADREAGPEAETVPEVEAEAEKTETEVETVPDAVTETPEAPENPEAP